MKKIIYHGSIQRLEHPFHGGGKSYNDYGVGFYCTENRELAAEWAVGKEHDGWINAYELELNELCVLDINCEDFCILHWLSVLLRNRSFDLAYPLARETRDYILKNFPVDYDDADIITGYRADDSYFTFAQDFLSGAISYRQLNRAMRLGKLGKQIVLKSKKAFSQLRFINAEQVSRDIWYPLREKRDMLARAAYFSSRNQLRVKDELFSIQLITGEIKADDPRLR